MSQPRPRFSPEVKEGLKQHLREAVAALKRLKEGLTFEQGALYILQIHRPSSAPATWGEFMENPLLQALRKEAAFQRLFQFCINERSVGEVLLSSDDPTDTDRIHSSEVFRNLIELELLNAAALLEWAESLDERLGNFISFLALDVVKRRVAVPLLNVDLCADERDIPEFGRLKRAHHEDWCDSRVPSAELSFAVTTRHFLGATRSPIRDEIGKRITLIRLAGHPLAAYNHFQVEFSPWELPLSDSEFAVRFWASGTIVSRIPAATLDESQLGDITAMAETLAVLHWWDKTTAWRLAVDRLDDAVFKLGCRSPDAIVDIVIGLESILAESDSRQESTHKVAVRAARYLEEAGQQRLALYRLVKQVYSARSALVHGQRYQLDPKALAQVEAAARTLARVLGRMAIRRESELNLTDLDLG